MSGEFGDENGGFFHDKIRNALEDARSSKEPITLAWAGVLEPLAKVARAISWFEACDSGLEEPLRASWEQVPVIQMALYRIERMTEVIQDAAVDAMLASMAPLSEPQWGDDATITLVVSPLHGEQPMWAHRVYDAALLKYVEAWARGQKRTDEGLYYWRLQSSSSGCGDTLSTYTYAPWSRDNQARLAIEEIRVLLSEPSVGILSKIHTIVARTPVRDLRRPTA